MTPGGSMMTNIVTNASTKNLTSNTDPPNWGK